MRHAQPVIGGGVMSGDWAAALEHHGTGAGVLNAGQDLNPVCFTPGPRVATGEPGSSGSVAAGNQTAIRFPQPPREPGHLAPQSHSPGFLRASLRQNAGVTRPTEAPIKMSKQAACWVPAS